MSIINHLSILELSASHFTVDTLDNLSQCSRSMHRFTKENLVYNYAYASFPSEQRKVINLARAKNQCDIKFLRPIATFEHQCVQLEDALIYGEGALDVEGYEGLTISRKQLLKTLEKSGCMELFFEQRPISKDGALQEAWEAYMQNRLVGIMKKETDIRHEQETVGSVLYWLLLESYCGYPDESGLGNLGLGDVLTDRIVCKRPVGWRLEEMMRHAELDEWQIQIVRLNLYYTRRVEDTIVIIESQIPEM